MYGPPPPAPFPPQQPKKSNPWLFGCLGCGCLAFLLFFFVSCAALISSSGSERAAPRPTESAAASQGSPTAAEENEEADSAEKTEEPPEEDRPEEPEPETHDGSGDTVLRVDVHEDPRIARITHTGSSNFAVWTVNSSGETEDLLVNEIGDYEGSVVYNTLVGEELAAFDITADGSWKITLEPLTTARAWTGKEISGSGDDVVQVSWDIDGLEVIEMSHSGSSNFAIWAYGDGRDLLANEIGNYEGETLLSSDTALFAITADGAWTLRRQ